MAAPVRPEGTRAERAECSRAARHRAQRASLQDGDGERSEPGRPEETIADALTGAVEKQDWDAQGRLALWSTKVTTNGKTNKTDRVYAYDGAGRLVTVTSTAKVPVAPTVFGYDVDDQVVFEKHGTAPPMLRFGGYRFEVTGAYGAPISGVGGHGAWAVEGFHGSDPDRTNGVVPHPLPTYVRRRSL